MILFNNRKLLFEGSPDILGEICSFLSQPWLLDCLNKKMLETRKLCARYLTSLKFDSSDPQHVCDKKSRTRRLLSRVASPSCLTVKMVGYFGEFIDEIPHYERIHFYTSNVPTLLEYLKNNPSLKDSIPVLVDNRDHVFYERGFKRWDFIQLMEFGPTQAWIDELHRLEAFFSRAWPEIQIECLGLGMEVLKLGCTKLRDIDSLRNMGKLTVLELSGTLVTDISPISALRDLKALYLRFLPVTDLRHITNLKKLVVLDLFATQITEITGIKELKGLEELDISHTRVHDVSVLTSLPRITKLFAYATAVQSIDCLLKCSSLKVLVVTSEGAKLSFTPFAGSRTLRFLKTSTSCISPNEFSDVMIRETARADCMIYVEWRDLENTATRNFSPKADLRQILLQQF